MNRKLVRRISVNPIVRTVVRSTGALIGFLSRGLSRLRFSALVSNAENSVCHWSTEIKFPENIELGNRVTIGPLCSLGAMSPIRIGDYVRISRGVVIETAGLDLRSELPHSHLSKPITIGTGVWLAANVIVLGGVTIGDHAVIGAGAVITKNVAAGAIVVGSSARVLEFDTAGRS
jgi:maltose O-acetyltransferase